MARTSTSNQAGKLDASPDRQRRIRAAPPPLSNRVCGPEAANSPIGALCPDRCFALCVLINWLSSPARVMAAATNSDP